MRLTLRSFSQSCQIMCTKQGYALKNWVEGLSDEAYYTCESPKNSTKIVQPYICQRTKFFFDLSIKANLQAFQNHRKQAKYNIVFYRFPSLGLTEPP